MLRTLNRTTQRSFTSKRVTPLWSPLLPAAGRWPLSSRNYCHSRIAPQRWRAYSSTTAAQLRPYQEDSIRSVLQYLAKGERRLGISLATGGGKTVIFSHLIDRIPAPDDHVSQTLILAHRRELIEQAARHCRNLYPEKTVEVEMGKSQASGCADITIASVQSITSGNRLLRYSPDRFKLLLVDEAHHIVAPTYLDILRHFHLDTKDGSQENRTALVGVSATFSRSDGLRLGAAIDHIVYHKDYVDMIEDKWLADVRFTTVHTGADLSKVKTTHGDFQAGALSKAVNRSEINEITVRSWLAIAAARKSTLVFCVDLAHVSALSASFRTHGIDARFVTGDTQTKVRAERLASFKAGEFPVLLNCGIFTEGTDIPNIDCIILARPTKSRNLLVQMMGRGLRNFTGKVDCHVIDMVASLEKGIVTTPTLFGLDPQELVEDADADYMKSLQERREQEQKREAQAADTENIVQRISHNLNRNVTFTRYDDVNALIENASGEQHIRTISPLAWVQTDHDRYILPSTSGSFLTIKAQKEDFAVIVTRKLPISSAKTPYARPVAIATTSTLEDAINAADTYAKKKFLAQMLLTRAAWRRAPATETQVKFLNRFREKESQLDSWSITKGKAADLITKIKHGARGVLNRMKTEKAREDRESQKDEKWQQMQDRAQVKVGPLND